jgi:hypothetical protein
LDDFSIAAVVRTANSLARELGDHSGCDKGRVTLAFLGELENSFGREGARRFAFPDLECTANFFERSPHGVDRFGLKDKEGLPRHPVVASGNRQFHEAARVLPALPMPLPQAQHSDNAAGFGGRSTTREKKAENLAVPDRHQRKDRSPRLLQRRDCAS